MHRPRLALATICAAAALLAGACGDDAKIEQADVDAAVTTTTVAAESTETTKALPTTAAAPVYPDPCGLVTKEMASAILPGATLLDGVSAGQGDNISCGYAGDPNGPTAQVEVYVGAGALKTLEIDRDTLAHEFTDVPDVGDEAHLEDGAIFFRVASVWVQIRTVTLDVPTEVVQANLIAVAVQAAATM